jgi:AcrR family transcriptional regulator
VGLYQIASHAGVPPASAYHFFPTKEAAFVALAQRYCDDLFKVYGEPIDARTLRSWQELGRLDMRRTMAFFNDRPPALKIFYGGYAGVETGKIGQLTNVKLGTAARKRLERIYFVPHTARTSAQRGGIVLGIIDAIWTLSVQGSGHINEDYFEESCRAATAYRRLYLPEYLELREEFAAAAERGDLVSLPFEEDGGPDAVMDTE